MVPELDSKFDIAFFPRKLLKNPYFARSSNDRIAFCAFLFGGHLSLWYEVFHVLPFYYPQTNVTVLFHYVIAAVLYVNCLAHMFAMVKARTCRDFSEIANKQRSDWKYCVPCQGYFPPRSHHCKICNVCILKRDHHCWFAGCCVGHDNHRYYCLLIFYMWFAALYANFFHFTFVGHQMGGFGLGTLLSLLVPHMAALTGFLTFYQFIIATFTFIAFFLLVMLSWLLQIQISQMCHGQTKFEKAKGISNYDLGLRENVREIFGENWQMCWLAPWVYSPLPGDGVSFRKSIKDKGTFKQY